MADAGKSTPAILWRVFFLLLAARGFAAAPASPPNELSQFGKPDPAAAARFLAESRHAGIPGEYYLDFELHALPRRGEKRVFTGRMWGGSNRQGTVNRIEITDGEGRRHRLLVQGGENPAVWRFDAGDTKPLGAGALFSPLIPGVEVTAFDLQHAYLYWPDATLQSINRIMGRPAYAYLFRPPPGFSSGDSGVAAVRVFFDTQFKQPLQSELLDQAGKVLKTFSVVSLKTVDVDSSPSGGKQTVPREVDFRNDITRDKTRLEIKAVAFNESSPAGVFDPAKLAADMPAPSSDRLIPIDR